VDIPPLATRIQRFAFFGLLVTGIHVLVAVTFIRLIDPSPPVANGVAFVVATASSYLLNTLWTFNQPLRRRTLRRFLAVSLIGCALAMAVSAAAEAIGWSYLYGIALVVLTVPATTFLLHSLWTYR
jgi:putative flippase GtrA